MTILHFAIRSGKVRSFGNVCQFHCCWRRPDMDNVDTIVVRCPGTHEKTKVSTDRCYL